MGENKTSMLTIKITPEKLEKFRIAAMLRAQTMSGLVNSFVDKIIEEEMEAVPWAFEKRIDGELGSNN